jgi:hypothetical protein
MTKASTLKVLAVAALLLQSCGSNNTGEDTELAAVLDSAADRAGMPAGACRDDCVADARAVLDECLAETDDREECLGRAIQSLFACVKECPPPTCEQRCEAEARQQYMECVDQTGDEDTCAAQAREDSQLCKAEICMAPEPPPCEDRCAERARELYESCVAQGGDEKRCKKAAKKILERCIEKRCEQLEPPPCEDQCEAVATHVLKACTDHIDAERACEAVARWFLELCNDHCETSPEPSEPSECFSGDDCGAGQTCQIEVCVNTCVDEADPVCVDTCIGVCVSDMEAGNGDNGDDDDDCNEGHPWWQKRRDHCD